MKKTLDIKKLILLNMPYTCQMEWVQRCNNIHNRAEEIILHEMVYS